MSYDSISEYLALRAYAESRGEDYDALLEGASKVIPQAQLQPRTAPLTEEEIDTLIENDNQALGGPCVI